MAIKAFWKLKNSSSDYSWNWYNWTDSWMSYQNTWPVWWCWYFSWSWRISLPTNSLITWNLARTFWFWSNINSTTADTWQWIICYWVNWSWQSFEIIARNKETLPEDNTVYIRRYTSDQCSTTWSLEYWKWERWFVSYSWVTTWTSRFWWWLRFWKNWIEIWRNTSLDFLGDVNFNTSASNQYIWYDYGFARYLSWYLANIIELNTDISPAFVKNDYAFAKWFI